MQSYEIVQYSALSIGLKGKWTENTYHIEKDGKQVVWNPLESDTDALLLLMEKDIHIYTIVRGEKAIGFSCGDFKVIFKTELQKPIKYRELIATVAASYSYREYD